MTEADFSEKLLFDLKWIKRYKMGQNIVFLSFQKILFSLLNFH